MSPYPASIVVEPNNEDVQKLEHKLALYDRKFFPDVEDGFVRIGIKRGEDLIAGVDACITSFHILYVSTVYVAESCRRQGIGRMLFQELGKRARTMGVNMIRLDSFNW